MRAVAAEWSGSPAGATKGYGYMVVIDHGSYQTLYAHLQQTPERQHQSRRAHGRRGRRLHGQHRLLHRPPPPL